MSERTDRLVNLSLTAAREQLKNHWQYMLTDDDLGNRYLDAAIEHLKDARAILKGSKEEKPEDVQP